MTYSPLQRALDSIPSRAVPAPVTLAAARDFIAATYRRVVGTEDLPPSACRGRILAQDIVAPIDLPRFDAAAVDGYAVIGADLATGPARLRVIGRAAAGHPSPQRLGPFEALRIFTGAMLPAGATRVVMQEDCIRDGDGVVVRPPKRDGSNIRRRGEDVAAGSIALRYGERLDAPRLALAAALHLDFLPVQRRLKVALFSTGDEVRAPGEAIAAGQIADANRPLIGALLQDLGCSVEDGGILRDDPEAQIARLIEAAARNDLIVTSGGASVGEEDHLTKVIQRRGSLEVWWLKIKPGKPVGLGDIDDCPILALPGNPVAAALTFLMLGTPLVARLSGARDLEPRVLRLPTQAAIVKRAGRWEAITAHLVHAPGEATQVVADKKTGSAMLGALSTADGFIVLPEEVELVAAGDLVDFVPLPRG
jgi:molybdopterin molybdotransferase